MKKPICLPLEEKTILAPLEKLAEKKGISVQELIRSILSDFLETTLVDDSEKWSPKSEEEN
jgi:hypothetical protein